MSILDNILKIFKIPNTKEIILHNTLEKSTSKLPELDNIGVDTPNCPYCKFTLNKFPSKKTKCKNCGEYIYVRTRPLDYKKVLIKENEIELIEEEWEKKKYINSIPYNYIKTKESKNEIQVIDASSKMNNIVNKLLANYKNYYNYSEILRIDKKDRLPILKRIWSNWAYRIDEKWYFYNYPQYNRDDLRFICEKEHIRVNILYHQQKYIDCWEKHHNSGFYFPLFVYFESMREHNIAYQKSLEKQNNMMFLKPENPKYCLIYDMDKVFDCWWVEDETHKWVDKYSFIANTRPITEKDLSYSKFWINGELKKLSSDEFKNWLKSRNINYNIALR